MRTKRPWFETLTQRELLHVLNSVSDASIASVLESFKRNALPPDCPCIECRVIAVKLGLRKTTN